MSSVLSSSDKAAYLANVLCVAKADDGVTSEEADVLRAIVGRIEADQQDLMDARQLLGDGHYQLRFMKEPGDRLANMQDMVMMALADGTASEAESRPIERLASIMKFAQADIDMIVRRAEAELRRIKKTSSTEPGARRLKRTSSQPPPLAEPTPKPEVPPRPSPPVSPPAAETGPLPPTGPVPAPVAEMQPSPEPSAPPVTAVSRVEECRRRRALSDQPAAYCFGCPDEALNVWGCRLAGMPWAPGSEWLSHGAFRDDDTFVFDRAAIGERLTSGLREATNCPHLNIPYVEAAFALLPARGCVWGRWRHRMADGSDPGARTVSVRQYVHGCPIASTATVKGVDPVGVREALKLIARAARRCGRGDIDPRRLQTEARDLQV